MHLAVRHMPGLLDELLDRVARYLVALDDAKPRRTGGALIEA